MKQTILNLVKKNKIDMDNLGICLDLFIEKINEVFTHFMEKGYSTQSILKNYVHYFIESKTYDNMLERCLKMRSIRGYTLEKCILMYGEELGREKWKEYCDRQAYTKSKEYKGMTDEEFRVFNLSRAATLENFISRHGEELGREKWKEYCDRQAYTNSLEYYIEKYGESGAEAWKELNSRKGHSIDSYIARFGRTEGTKGYIKYKREYSNNFYSGIASELFSKLDEMLNMPDLKIHYSPKTKEFGKFNKILRQYNYYDFVISDIKLCIEFNGDVFHANPKTFKKDDRPNPFDRNKTSEEIWEYDRIKTSILESSGYDIIIVWESDYLNDKEGTEKYLFNLIKDRLNAAGIYK